MTRRRLLWFIPLAAVAVAAAAILALPGYVASGYHRATIEALASSLTGRDVHINGKLSLALLPQPELIANNITINGPDHETFTAASLTLDIAPGPLLHGQLSARSIMLQSPRIALPWPLPGGAAAVAPPPWLAALHAQINNGQVSLGAATFTHVAADIFTSSGGALSVSGSGNLFRLPINLSLSLGQLSAVGSAPVTLDVQSTDATKLTIHVSGSFDGSSTLTGAANIAAASLASIIPVLTQPLTATAALTADPSQLSLSNLNILQGSASLNGTATLSFAGPLLTLTLSGSNLTLPGLPAAGDYGALPTHLTLNATSVTLAGIAIPQLQTKADFTASGIAVTAFEATFPSAKLSLSGSLDPTGNLQGKASFNATDLTAFAALPAAWQQADLTANLSGTLDTLSLDHLTGTLGPARITGAAIFSQPDTLAGQLHFDQLDLTPFIAALRNRPAIDADLEITADRASLGKIPLTHLLLDASLNGQLVVRRLSASLYGGLTAASFTITPGGQITSARAILAIPSATPIAALLPASLQPPAILTKAPLAVSILAAGPADALATSATLALGDISVTAAPTLDLTRQTATGPFTLRHPSAIAAMKAFGLNSGLAWPGPGSIALRADIALTPTQLAFPDFVLSFGDLTANGSLSLTSDHQLNGQIDADTLALPPIPPNLTLPWAALANAQGKIGISANQVLLAGNPILGPAAAAITLNPNKFSLAIGHATLANGALTGNVTATATAAPQPSLAAQLTLTGADTSTVNLPIAFPFTLPTGTMDATANLTASGYAPPAWLATLTGTASLAAKSGTISGFNLAGIGAAVSASAHRASHLRAACLTGVTPFSTLTVDGSFNSGVYTISSAALQGPMGAATATGGIDLPDSGLTLTLTLTPNVPAPPNLRLTVAGNWTSPRKIPALKPALAWKPPATTNH